MRCQKKSSLNLLSICLELFKMTFSYTNIHHFINYNHLKKEIIKLNNKYSYHSDWRHVS
jgi:hypothetical protein